MKKKLLIIGAPILCIIAIAIVVVLLVLRTKKPLDPTVDPTVYFNVEINESSSDLTLTIKALSPAMIDITYDDELENKQELNDVVLKYNETDKNYFYDLVFEKREENYTLTNFDVWYMDEIQENCHQNLILINALPDSGDIDDEPIEDNDPVEVFKISKVEDTIDKMVLKVVNSKDFVIKNFNWTITIDDNNNLTSSISEINDDGNIVVYKKGLSIGEHNFYLHIQKNNDYATFGTTRPDLEPEKVEKIVIAENYYLGDVTFDVDSNLYIGANSYKYSVQVTTKNDAVADAIYINDKKIFTSMLERNILENEDGSFTTTYSGIIDEEIEATDNIISLKLNKIDFKYGNTLSYTKEYNLEKNIKLMTPDIALEIGMDEMFLSNEKAVLDGNFTFGTNDIEITGILINGTKYDIYCDPSFNYFSLELPLNDAKKIEITKIYYSQYNKTNLELEKNITKEYEVYEIPTLINSTKAIDYILTAENPNYEFILEFDKNLKDLENIKLDMMSLDIQDINEKVKYTVEDNKIILNLDFLTDVKTYQILFKSITGTYKNKKVSLLIEENFSFALSDKIFMFTNFTYYKNDYILEFEARTPERENNNIKIIKIYYNLYNSDDEKINDTVIEQIAHKKDGTTDTFYINGISLDENISLKLSSVSYSENEYSSSYTPLRDWYGTDTLYTIKYNKE